MNKTWTSYCLTKFCWVINWPQLTNYPSWLISPTIYKIQLRYNQIANLEVSATENKFWHDDIVTMEKNFVGKTPTGDYLGHHS